MGNESIIESVVQLLKSGTEVLPESRILQDALNKFLQEVISFNENLSEDLIQIIEVITSDTHNSEDYITNIKTVEKMLEDYFLKKELQNISQPLHHTFIIPDITIRTTEQQLAPLKEIDLHAELTCLTDGLENIIPEEILQRVYADVYDGMTLQELRHLLILNTTSLIEKEPDYSKLAARLLNKSITQEVSQALLEISGNLDEEPLFCRSIKMGIEKGLLDAKLNTYDLWYLSKALDLARDLQFDYLGLKNLYDRYFLRVNDHVIETPQIFFMRVAMGLALTEKTKRDNWAIEFYNTLSSFNFVSSTPTLFNSGTQRSQLSSCFLNTCYDSIESITEIWQENSFLSKWAGGIATDWTYIRALGSHIKGTNGKSTGLIPFLKVNNDIAIAVNQGGKRRGSFASYLEIWHLDFEEFIQLRRNVGDERRRTLDMHTVAWIPDLFMERVLEDKEWILFSPRDNYLDKDIRIYELHDLYGDDFRQKYEYYEKLAEEGQIPLFKKVRAKDLWQKLLLMLFETGHPWITFKDPINARNPQKHKGVIHSSNLCTEITLNTSETETAVCNLGSLNIVNHIHGDDIDVEKLKKTVTTALRMLDNVVDINFYPTEKTKRSNLAHRPVGLGLMGFHDALMMRHIPYDSDEAVEFADRLQEFISYFAISASCQLAQERGSYSTFAGSEWSKGNLPIDTFKNLSQTRNQDYLDLHTESTLDWEQLRTDVMQHGLRNSNCMAIAPTATISNISGVSPSVDPIYKQIHVASNLSGKFMMMNHYLVKALKEINLWNDDMIEQIKIHDGSIQNIEEIPDPIKQVFKNAFELDPFKLIECAARRQKWVDQSQSLNIYVQDDGRRKFGAYLNDLYVTAWKKGLKTTYYLKTQGASSIEKSTVKVESSLRNMQDAQVCSIINGEDCEACQ